MNAIVFSVLPVFALLVIAVVGLVWLRQPVDAQVERSNKRETVAEAVARLEEVSRKVETLARSVPAPTKRQTSAGSPRAKAS